MKYLIAAENSICASLSRPLIKEIQRFDIRNDIIEVSTERNKALRSIKESNPDLLIIIGSKKSRGLMQFAKKYGVKSCFFYQSLLDTNPTLKWSETADNKVYFDIPMDLVEEGNLLADFIRQRVTEISEEAEIREAVVSIVGVGISKSISFLQKELSKKETKINYQLIDVSGNFERDFQKIKQSNAIIGTDRFSSMLAVFTNCPMVNVYSHRLFSKPQNKKTIVNELLDKEAIGNHLIKNPKAIADEVSRMLNDHQYSAGIMDDYQQLKSKIGTQPYARRVAQEIVEWMEESA